MSTKFPIATPGALRRLRAAGRVKRIPVPAGTASAPSPAGENGLQALDVIGPVPMPLTLAGRELTGRWYVAAPATPGGAGGDRNDHVSVISFGNPGQGAGLPLVRIHSTCFTGDVLGSLRCDCGPQLTSALQQVSESATGGMVVYMAGHEGRGIGLWSKAAAYLLQDEGLDTYEANRALGHQDDARDFRHAAAVIHHLLGGVGFRLLTNNPDKIAQMRALGLHDVVRQPHVVGVGARNCRYMGAKRRHGHGIPASALEGIGLE